MLTPAIKHAIKVMFVFIVIAGLIASYLFMGAPTQNQQATQEATDTPFRFISPSNEPSVNGSAGTPSVNGPTTPPPASQ